MWKIIEAGYKGMIILCDGYNLLKQRDAGAIYKKIMPGQSLLGFLEPTIKGVAIILCLFLMEGSILKPVQELRWFNYRCLCGSMAKARMII